MMTMMTTPTSREHDMVLKLSEYRDNLKECLEGTKITDKANLMRLLQHLNRIEISRTLLKTTQIGIIVGKLRKVSDVEVVRLSNEIVEKWKTCIGGDSTKTQLSHHHNTKRKLSEEEILSPNELPLRETNPSKALSQESETLVEATTSYSGLREIHDVGDPIRKKCIEMILTALLGTGFQGDMDDDHVVSLAEKIEECIYQEFPYTKKGPRDRLDEMKRYKAKIRSRFLNLKDKNNPALKERLILGHLSPEEFVRMSAEDLASEEMKKRDQMIREENLFKSRGPQDTEAETDQFKCGKCKQRKTKYFQMQTRSADEPMTTFVTCVVCGNRWKVSHPIDDLDESAMTRDHLSHRNDSSH